LQKEKWYFELVFLLHGRHGDFGLELSGILGSPELGDCLELSVEMHTGLAVEIVAGTDVRFLVSSEGEHWKRNWDWNVDSDLSSLNLMLELSGGSSVVGEDGGTVAPLVVVHKSDGFIESFGFDGAENGAEDFFLVSSHARLAAGDDSWADEVALFVARNGRVSAVEKKVAAFGDGLSDDTFDVFLRLWRNDRSDVTARFVARSAFEVLGHLEKVWDPLPRFTNEDTDWESHASLTSSAESGADELVKSGVLVGVGHDDSVVLGAHVRLDSLAVAASSAVVDVFASAVSADKGDSSDVLVVADEVDAVVRAVDGVEAASWETRVDEKLSKESRRTGNSLGRLHDESVSAHERDRVHPKGNHGGEVEGAHASNDTKWFTVGLDVQVLGESLEGFSLKKSRDSTSVLDNLKTSVDISFRIGESFSLLASDELGDLSLVLLDELLVLEHDLLTAEDGSFSPALVSFGRRFGDCVHF